MITWKRGMPFVIALLCVPISQLEACEVSVDCPHHGFEAARKFTVAVRHAGKPLKGAVVDVIPDAGGGISEITDAAGVVQFENLRPGRYHIGVSMLGIGAAYECFHVANWTTGLNAKRALTYNWGDDALETRQIAGKLVSRRLILDANGQHADTASAAGIRLTLTDPLTGVRHETTSGPEGLFLFAGTAEGIYILHSDGNDELRFYPGDILVRLNLTAARTQLVLELGGGGDCKSPLELLN